MYRWTVPPIIIERKRQDYDVSFGNNVIQLTDPAYTVKKQILDRIKIYAGHLA